MFSLSLCNARELNKYIGSRYVNVGLFQLRQVFFATYDLKVHMMKGNLIDRFSLDNTNGMRTEPTDYTKLWNELSESIILEKHDKLVPGQAAFRHMVGDYSAGYYGFVRLEFE